MKDIIKNKLNFIILSIFIFSFSINTKSFSQAKYSFAQQVGEGCVFLPMLNLNILNRLLKDYDDISQIPENKFVDRRTWFGEGYFYNKIFHNSFREMMLDKYKNVKNFINKCIEKGPLFPHVYTKDGNSIFADDSTLLKFPLLSFAFFPTFLNDRRATANTTFYEGEVKARDLDVIPNKFRYLPVVQKKDEKYYKYVRGKKGEFGDYKEIPETKLYEEFFDKQENYSTGVLGFKLVGMDFSSPHLTLVKHKKTCKYHADKNNFGGSLSCYEINNCDYYSFYNIGTYKLMLLRLGLDEKNKNVSQDLKKIFNENKKDNLWSDKYFNKDFFLEYQLAQIFKKDKKLFNKVMKSVDFYYPLMETYNKFFSLAEKGNIYRDKKGKIPYTIEILEKFLPDKEQMLAYNVMFNVMTLWYGAMNEKVFYKSTVEQGEFKEIIEGEKERRKFLDLGIEDLLRKDGTFKNYKNFSYEKGFIKLWKSIIEILKTKKIIDIKRLNFVNYSSHGNVISFDNDINKLQNDKAKNNKCDLKLLKDLGVSFIESFYCSELPTFYKIK